MIMAYKLLLQLYTLAAADTAITAPSLTMFIVEFKAYFLLAYFFSHGHASVDSLVWTGTLTS